MECPGPGQNPGRYRIRAPAGQRLAHDGIDASRHLLRSPSCKRKQQYALGAHALDDQVSNAVRKRHRLARTGTGDDEQRPGTERLVRCLAAIFGSLTLGWIQLRQVVIDVLGRLHHVSPVEKSVFLYSTGWIYKVR